MLEVGGCRCGVRLSRRAAAFSRLRRAAKSYEGLAAQLAILCGQIARPAQRRARLHCCMAHPCASMVAKGNTSREDTMRQRSRSWRILSLAIVSFAFASAAGAQDVVRVAVPQRGTWETSVPDLGEQAKIFAKHGVKIEALYTSGGGETMQALIAGSVDVAISTGTAAVFAAYVKGAPIRPVATSVTGAREIFWYVKADSPIKTLKDAAGKTMAFSALGSSSNLAALKLIKMAGVDIKLVSTGVPVATFTQTMTGQVDIGWSAAPF